MPDHPRVVELFLQLAAIEGTSGHERGVADYIRQFLGGLGMEVREDEARDPSGGDSGNVVARAGGGGDLALLAHMDTARPSGASKPQIHTDRITSDGTTVLGVDNRAGIAILLCAAEQVLARGPSNFTLGFTICEETSMVGAQQISLGASVRQAACFDSSLRPGNIVCRSYGCRHLVVTVKGKASHSGIAPERGINAIAVAAKAIARLPLGRIDGETTANVGLIRGGTATNVVPDEVIVEAEIRSVRAARVDELVDLFTQRFRDEAAAAGATIDMQSTWDFEPYTVDTTSPLYRRVARAMQTVGLDATQQVSAGGADANSRNARGLPTVNLGIGAANPHGNDEYILLDDLATGAAIATALIS